MRTKQRSCGALKRRIKQEKELLKCFEKEKLKNAIHTTQIIIETLEWVLRMRERIERKCKRNSSPR